MTNSNKGNGRHMVITVLMNQLMLIEGKVRDSIYIVKTYRRHAAHHYDRIVSSEHARHLKSVVASRAELLDVVASVLHTLARCSGLVLSQSALETK